MGSVLSVAPIEVAGLHKSYAGRPVLRDLTFSVARGEILAIVGPSGAGKSTLLRCLNGIEQIDAGRIAMPGAGDDEACHGKAGRLSDRAASRRRAHVGLVFQGFHLFPHMTVLENVIEAPMVVAGLSRRRAEDRARGLLRDFGLSGEVDAYPRTLSGGEQQRVAIVRALAMQPRVALFDEPTSALDRDRRHRLGEHLRNLAATGVTMVIASHDVGFVRRIADRVLVLNAGTILKEGAPDDVVNEAEASVHRPPRVCTV